MHAVTRLERLTASIRILALAGLGALMLAGQPADAQGAGSPVTVGLYESPPFVMFPGGGEAEGMAIDLWTELSEELGLQSDFRRFDTLRDMTRAVAGGEIDVAVTNLTITEDRLRRMDITQPWFNAGLRIMTHDEPVTGPRAIFGGLRDAGHLRAYGWLALVILLATLSFTLFDRRFDREFHRRWRDGIAHSFHTVMQVATSGTMPSRKNLFGWVGRIGQAFWLVFGLAILAYITSSVTSVMTTLAVTETINGPDDLAGARIGVFDGSTAEEFGALRGYDIRGYSGIAGAAEDLVAGRLDAVVADAPVLEYFAVQNPGLALNVVGPMFEPDHYGFALPPQSPLTDRLSIALLTLWEDGTIRRLDTDYFGHVW